MGTSFEVFWRRVWRCAAGFWLALVVAYGGYVFIYPTIPNYGPEIGPAASFIFVCAMFSVGYLGVFLFMVVPTLCLFRMLTSPARSERPDVH